MDTLNSSVLPSIVDISNSSTPFEVSTANNSFYGDDYSILFQTIILPCIYAIVTVVGLLGNGLVIYILQFKIQTKSITDVYVLNLALADFIFVSMIPLWTVELVIYWWPFGNAMCKIATMCTYFDMYASVFFMTALALDRVFAVVLYQFVRRTIVRARMIVVSIWIFAVLLAIIPTLFREVSFQPGIGLSRCHWTFNETSPWFTVYALTRSVFGFVIPVITIVVCYSAIVVFLKTRNTTGKLTEKRQDRATKMVLVVIGVFLACWLPIQISNLIYVIDSLRDVEPPPAHFYVHMFTTALLWSHSCVNPILYAFMREDLRRKMTEIYYRVKGCCLRGKTRMRFTENEVPMTPETQERNTIDVNEDERTQVSRLTHTEGYRKVSTESLTGSYGSNGCTKAGLSNENFLLLPVSPSTDPIDANTGFATNNCLCETDNNSNCDRPSTGHVNENDHSELSASYLANADAERRSSTGLNDIVTTNVLEIQHEAMTEPGDLIEMDRDVILYRKVPTEIDRLDVNPISQQNDVKSHGSAENYDIVLL